jgi:glycosyltransferase involved in cell wall biosynthesis
MISYVLPTRDRPERLQRTFERIGTLEAASHDRIGGAEVIVIDNASEAPLRAARALDNGWPLITIRLEHNAAAAARNVGAERACGAWIVMLDDDSFPLDDGLIDAMLDAPADIAAIGADIRLPDGSREAGGLPEVIIGCGAAIRRKAFLAVGGYDPAFEFYAEEYDLCARLIRAGWRIAHDVRFRVRHEKVAQNRDMNGILRRLVRNNGWTIARYAPAHRRQALLDDNVQRYAAIAMNERASSGFSRGMAELLESIAAQPDRTMTEREFDRFSGLAAARAALGSDPRLTFGAVRGGACRVAMVEPGKNAWAVEEALRELGCRVVKVVEGADAVVVGTLSPGPMLDAAERWRRREVEVVCPAEPFRSLEHAAVC